MAKSIFDMGLLPLHPTDVDIARYTLGSAARGAGPGLAIGLAVGGLAALVVPEAYRLRAFFSSGAAGLLVGAAHRGHEAWRYGHGLRAIDAEAEQAERAEAARPPGVEMDIGQ